MSFTEKDFRDALGLFPTGVAVVTAWTSGGYKIGVTVNSFTSVSLNPALISFNLAKSRPSTGDLTRADVFAINILHERQSHISSSFARAEADKWACTECSEGKLSTPVVADTLATFECGSYACHEAGDHVIIVGRVLHIAVNSDASPLVFYRSRYSKVGGVIENKSPSEALARN